MVISGRESLPMSRDLLSSFIVSSILWCTFVIYYIVQWLVERILHIGDQKILIWFYGGLVDFAQTETWPAAITLLFILLIVTTIFIFIVIISSESLAAIVKHIYSFGPDGLDRVNQIILVLAGIIASIISLWAAFS